MLHLSGRSSFGRKRRQNLAVVGSSQLLWNLSITVSIRAAAMPETHRAHGAPKLRARCSQTKSRGSCPSGRGRMHHCLPGGDGLKQDASRRSHVDSCRHRPRHQQLCRLLCRTVCSTWCCCHTMVLRRQTHWAVPRALLQSRCCHHLHHLRWSRRALNLVSQHEPRRILAWRARCAGA